MIDISIIVTVFNKAAYLPNMLRGLKELDDGYVKQFIFVNDKSIDNSLEILQEQTKGWENVIIHTNDVNSGPAVSTNVGVELSSGRFIFFLDGDDIFAPNAFKVMGGLMEETGVDALYFRHKNMPTASGYSEVKPMPKEIEYEIMDRPELHLENITTGSSTFGITRELLEKIGKVCDERIFIQDYSLCIRIVKRATRMLRLKTPALYYLYDTGNAVSKMRLQGVHDKAVIYYIALTENYITERSCYEFAVKQTFKLHHKNCWKNKLYKKSAEFYLYRRIIGFLPKGFITRKLKEIYEYYRANYDVR